MTMRAVADELARKGVLDSPRLALTPLGLIDLLVSGKVVQHSLTLVEGWTFRQMMDAVDADPYLSRTSLPVSLLPEASNRQK